MTDSHASYSERAKALCQKSEENRCMTSHRFFLGYLHGWITSAPLYAQWRRLLSYVRRFRTITFLLRTLGVLLTVLQTGALVLVGTLLFLVLLPSAAALMLGILLTALLESRRSNRYLRNHLDGRPVTVLFLSEEASPFAIANAKDLAARGNTVLAVSPYLISAKGLHRRASFSCTLRQEFENVFLVRKYYFFSLQKQVLSHAEVTFLY
ncbi:MAG: hypothetical protein IIX80_00410 [Clostridia bacterium]|nr:hypothetical protein [Clostridia bacterium]